VSTERRPDESMTLLTTMMERPLDAGYQEAADRRIAAGLPGATSTRTVLVVVLAILTGFLFAVAAQSLRPKPTAAAAVKKELVTRIEALQKHGTDQEAKVAALGKQVRDYEALALQQSGGTDLTSTIKDLEVQAGAVPLTGPGLTLTLDDAASTDTGADAGSRPTSGFQEGRVTSGDLQPCGRVPRHRERVAPGQDRADLVLVGQLREVEPGERRIEGLLHALGVAERRDDVGP